MSQIFGALIGRWVGTVSYGPKVEEFTIDFEDNGGVTLTTAGTKGYGNWSTTGDDTFDFTVEEKLNHGDSGSLDSREVNGIDHLMINISARLSGSSFEGSGMARVYDAAGSEIIAVAAQTSAQQLAAS